MSWFDFIREGMLMRVLKIMLNKRITYKIIIKYNKQQYLPALSCSLIFCFFLFYEYFPSQYNSYSLQILCLHSYMQFQFRLIEQLPQLPFYNINILFFIIISSYLFIFILFCRYMQDHNQQTCPNCSNSFTQHNPPRKLIYCSHFLCQRCIIAQKICKRCGSDIGLNNHFLKDYPIVTIDRLDQINSQKLFSACKQNSDMYHEQSQDQILLSSQQNTVSHIDTDQFVVDECLLHLKPADLICIDDRAIICSSCALFGKHKGHEIINRQGVLTKFACFIEDCLKIYDELKTQIRLFSSQFFRSQYKKTLIQKRQQDQRKVSQKFESLISIIKIAEKKQHLKIAEFYKQRQKKLEMQLPSIQKIQKEISTWLIKIQNLGSLITDTSRLQKISECIPYIYEKSKIKSDILQNGSRLLDRLNQNRCVLQNQLLQQKETNWLKFDDEKIKTLSNYVFIGQQPKNIKKQTVSIIQDSPYANQRLTIEERSNLKLRSSSMKQHLKTEGDSVEKPLRLNQKCHYKIEPKCFVDDLLLSVQPPKINIRIPEAQTNIFIQRVHLAEQVDVDNIPHLSISDIKPVTNRSSDQSSDQSRFLQKDRQLKQFINSDGFCGLAVHINKEKEDSKKKKKVDFPDKFRGTVDDLKNDRAETIDLTGAEVGDGSILSICPFIKKSKKLKTLKLIKNRLTDECLGELFEALAESKVCSLNLSQNLLTDKSCSIIQSSSISPQLKTITLSLNKINRRNVKMKIDELSKKNVTVLL